MPPGMLPAPQIPQPPSQGAAPAMPGPGQMQQGGKEARGKVVAGLGLEMLRISIPLLANSEDGQAVIEAVAKLGKRFVKPAEDLGQAELKFMGSQMFGGGAGGPGGGPGAAPSAPSPSMPQPAPLPMAA